MNKIINSPWLILVFFVLTLFVAKIYPVHMTESAFNISFKNLSVKTDLKGFKITPLP